MLKPTLILSVLAAANALAVPLPANDNFADASPLTGSGASFSGSNIAATREVGEPAGGGDRSVWFKWTSPAYGVAQFSALFATDHRMEIYVGSSIVNLIKVGADTDTTEPSTTFNVGKDVTYFVRFTNEGNSDSPGSFTALFDLDTNGFTQALFKGTSYQNDSFSQAKAVSGTKIKVLGYPTSASREAGEPIETGYNTLWWKWTAPSDGKTIFSTAGSDVGTKNRLTVGTGSSLADFDFYSENGDSEISFVINAKKGKTYYIALGETYYFGLDNWSYILTIDHTKDSGNDPGKGFNAKFKTLPIDVLNHSQIKGVFDATGLTSWDIKFDSSRFEIDEYAITPNGKKWVFSVHKKSFAAAPMNGKFTVIGYRGTKVAAKVVKTFHVW